MIRLMRKPLRNQGGMQYAVLVPHALADHAIMFPDFAGVNVLDLVATVPLTDPSRRAVVLDGPLVVRRTCLADRPRRFVRAEPYDIYLPPRPLCLRLGHPG